MEDLELMCVMVITFAIGKLLFEKLDLYFKDLKEYWKEDDNQDEE